MLRGCRLNCVSDTAASGSREGYRRWLFSSILPMARIIEREVLAKTNTMLAFSFDALAAADLQARATGICQHYGREAIGG